MIKSRIQISLQVPAPQGIKLEDIITRATEAALEYEKATSAWLSAMVVDDDMIHSLNRDFRGVDRPTDVLSFPMDEGEEVAAAPDGFLGDIVISLPRAQAQAEEYGHPLLREISFLTIHATLHLLGYDHMDEEAATDMFKRQEEILTQMGVLR